jgi:hypothetical protein
MNSTFSVFFFYMERLWFLRVVFIFMVRRTVAEHVGSARGVHGLHTKLNEPITSELAPFS